MNVGDLVRWIGFPGASSPNNILGKGQGVGIIVAERAYVHVEDFRYDVLWKDGTIGYNLYPQTIEVIE